MLMVEHIYGASFRLSVQQFQLADQTTRAMKFSESNLISGFSLKPGSFRLLSSVSSVSILRRHEMCGPEFCYTAGWY